MARLRKSSLIKRYDYPYTRRSLVTTTPTPDDPFANSTTSYVFVRGVVEACSVQNASSWDMNSLPEGSRTKQVFKIFTNTMISTAIENTNTLSDSVYLPDSFFNVNGVQMQAGVGGWYNVIKVSFFMNGVIPHVEAFIAKDDYTLNADGISQFPSTTSLDLLVSTNAELKNSILWKGAWIGENV